MPKRKLINEQVVIDRYGNRRFGSFVTGDQVVYDKHRWRINVKCDCGTETTVPINSLKNHRECACKLMLRMRDSAAGVGSHSLDALAELWPAIINAGKKTMEKYNAMASM